MFFRSVRAGITEPQEWIRLVIFMSRNRAKAAPPSASCMLLCKNRGTLRPQDTRADRFDLGHRSHGCLQAASFVGMDFIQNTGYNMWADTNDIIVLYPQAAADDIVHAIWDGLYLSNPNGCWDWVGWYGNNSDQIGGNIPIQIPRALEDRYLLTEWKLRGSDGGYSQSGQTNHERLKLNPIMVTTILSRE